jgi:hypothetical protein
MPIVGNQQYADGLIKHLKRGVDQIVKAVVRESLTWVTIMTVQDSGNAAAQWRVSLNGNQDLQGFDLRGEGFDGIGSRREYRRPADSIKASDDATTIQPRSSDALQISLSSSEYFIDILEMNDDYEYHNIALYNPIPESPDGGKYESFAFAKLISLGSQIKTFGFERGYQVAKNTTEVKRVTR